MATGTGEKSEKPTANKLSKARKKGDISRSKDVTMAALLSAAFIILTLLFPYYKILIKELFISISMMAGKLNDMVAIEQFVLRNFLVIMKFLMTLLPLPFICISACLIPGGWIFAPEKIIPDIKKISLISGFKRLFAINHITEVLKMLIKCSLLLYMLYVTVKIYLNDIIFLQALPVQHAISHGFSMYHYIMLYFIGVIIIFAIIDIPLSKHIFIKKMMMTKQEVKQEHKNSDGDPGIKSRIRRLQYQFSMGLINKVVPTADVIIANPTHYAVALKYDPKKANAPYIIAKGKDELALHIRQVAQQYKIEVVVFPLLARAVYNTTRVNQQVPGALYRAIAHVLNYVMHIKSWRLGQANKPALDIQHLTIPKEMM